jgi:DNA-binding MarR family transcriptional regulator
VSSALQREIRQRRPFQSPGHEAVLGLMRTADLVRRHGAAIVEPHGITLQQFNVLRILRGAGDEGLPTLEVADRMIERTPGVTRLLDRMEAKELVRRERCPKAKGLALLEKIDPLTSKAHEESLKGLRQKDLVTFIRLMDAIRAAHQ